MSLPLEMRDHRGLYAYVVFYLILVTGVPVLLPTQAISPDVYDPVLLSTVGEGDLKMQNILKYTVIRNNGSTQH